jgi:ABC-type Fe3+-hydroxamate transport system substrate-binding protein
LEKYRLTFFNYGKIRNEESILIAERREYISKLHYWKGQEKKAKKYILKYDDTIKKLDKDIEQRKEKRDEINERKK